MSRILALAAAAGLLACLFGVPLLHLAENRLVTGAPIYAAGALGVWTWPVAVCAASGLGLLGVRREGIASFVAIALLSDALLLLLAGLGQGASGLIQGHPPASRARLAEGAWLAMVGLACGLAAASGRLKIPAMGWLALTALVAGLALLLRAGTLDGLSLVVEARARLDEVREGTVQHLGLAGAGFLLAVTLVLSLAPLRRGRGGIDLLVSGLQVVPAVALLGGLVALLSALLAAVPALRSVGLAALGPGPAVVGIAAYLLLPLRRGWEAALASPDRDALDAAQALGLDRRQVLTGLRLPLGASILIGACRVAAVQALGLATLGALVGAGGLGRLVFDGMAQFAPDLILLGALPIIALSLLCDRLLALAEAAARRRWPS